MPYIFISAVALCANLYRCAPLIVGDKYADPELMNFLGAKITTDYPEPNSPPMYVMFATMRSVLDALQEIGYELNSSQVVQGYTTWIMSKPAEGDAQRFNSESTIIPVKSTDETVREPEVAASKPRRSKPKKKDKAVETEERGNRHCYELSAEESAEVRAASSRSVRRGREKDNGYPNSRDTSYKRLPRSESEYTRTEAQRQRRPVSDHEEPNRSLKDLRETSSKEMKREEPSKDVDAEQPQKDLGPNESEVEETAEPETKPKTSDGSPVNKRKLNKWSSDMAPSDKTSKHKGTKATGRKSSTPVKENFKK